MSIVEKIRQKRSQEDNDWSSKNRERWIAEDQDKRQRWYADEVRQRGAQEREREYLERLNRQWNEEPPNDGPLTLEEVLESDLVMEIQPGRVAEKGVPITVPFLIAKEDGEVVFRLPLCEYRKLSGCRENFGELHVPDIMPYVQMVEHHNSHIQRNKE